MFIIEENDNIEEILLFRGNSFFSKIGFKSKKQDVKIFGYDHVPSDEPIIIKINEN